MFRLAKSVNKSSSSSLDVAYLVEDLDFTFFFLPSFTMRHLWPTLGEEEAFGDGDVGSVLVGGGVGGDLVGVPLLANMGIVALLVVPLLFSPLSLLVIIPVTITRQRTFSDKMTGLTTLVANFLRAGLVVFPPPLLEDLAKALDDERHLLIVELGGVDGDPTRCRVFFLLLRCLEGDGLHLGC
jgi:hypothetical protein